jgi:hypothetical protein
MERDHNQFTPELLKMIRDEEREKFLAALKDGASWAQLYQIRNTIRKLNEMIEVCENKAPGSNTSTGTAGRGEEENPRSASSLA